MYLDTTPLQKNALVVHMYIGMYMLIYVPTCTGVPKVLLISALSFVKSNQRLCAMLEKNMLCYI